MTVNSAPYRILVKSKRLTYFSWTCVALFALLSFWWFFDQAWTKLLIAIALVAPAIFFQAKAGKRVPPLYSAVFLVATLLNLVCMGWGLYAYPYTDDLSHFVTAFALAPCCAHFLLADVLNIFRKRPAIFAIIAVSLTMTAAAGWEIFEYVLQVSAGYQDTIADLAWGFVGSCASSAWAARELAKKGAKSPPRVNPVAG